MTSDKPLIRDIISHSMGGIEIFDIGAMVEGQERFASLVSQDLANVNGFEPNPTAYEQLCALNAPRRRYFPYFLGRGGPRTFYVTQYPGCSSLFEPDPAVIDLFQTISAHLPGGNFAVVRTEQVNTVRLDDVPGLPSCDFMKLDVQGSELDVLHGAANTLASAVVLEVEVEFVPLYKNQPLFGHVQAFLHEQGFLLHKFIDVSGRAFKPCAIAENAFASMSQMLWADAIFVRNFASPDLYSDAQLLKAAAILYDMYNSYDLAHYYLQKYDDRHQTGLATAFRQIVGCIPDLPLTYLNPKTRPH